MFQGLEASGRDLWPQTAEDFGAFHFQAGGGDPGFRGFRGLAGAECPAADGQTS